MKKAMINFLLVLMFLACGCSIIAPTDAVNPNTKDVVLITIPEGTGASGIAEILKEKNLIKSTMGFKEMAKKLSAQNSMKAGAYELSQSMSAEDIIKKLKTGDIYIEKVKVVVPEGFEVKQIKQRLVEAGLVEGAAFDKAIASAEFDYRFLKGLPEGPTRLEGFLYPATYRFPKNGKAEEIIDIMLKAFDKNFKEEYYTKAEEKKMSILQVVTLASIVEREAKIDNERPIVASVFYNRLKIKQPLQSCATVQYALGERKQRLLYADLEIKSPYNTYKNAGLPPGPIASPGSKSIDAVLNPAETEFLFFRTSAKADGSHDFSKTFEQHQQSGEGAVKP